MIPRDFPDWWPEWDPIDVAIIRAWHQLEQLTCRWCGKTYDTHDWRDTGWTTVWTQCPEQAARAQARDRWDATHRQGDTPEKLGFLQHTIRGGWPHPNFNWFNDDEEVNTHG